MEQKIPAQPGLNFDVEHLAAAIHAILGIHAMRAESAAIGRILGELGSFESIGSATVGAAAFGLFAFRIGHDDGFLSVGVSCKTPAVLWKGSGKRWRSGASSAISASQLPWQNLCAASAGRDGESRSSLGVPYAMSPTILQILLLGLIQGAAELLPVSSSAHVIVAEKLMKLDPSSPEMTFLLVMLHTGTMFAVIAYFWSAWKKSFLSSKEQFTDALIKITSASVCTATLYLGLEFLIKEFVLGGQNAEIEQLFSSLPLIAGSLFVAGILILWSAFKTRKKPGSEEVSLPAACWIGIIQGVSLPFRGFSRSGSTISVGLLKGVGRRQAEVFSFALGVVLTPAAIYTEFHRFLKFQTATAGSIHPGHLIQPGLIGMAGSFVAGLLALRWLSGWLENGRWHYFGYYCVGAAAVIFILSVNNF
jgi:undecaprenyl-diphosphatase